MDINDVRGIGTILALIAFISIIAWAYSSSRKDRFEEDGNILFKDDEKDDAHPQQDSENEK